ncbi:MAG TPA: alpha/beta fold hydrolase [Steroidobacteraceae bacterium]|nr:alpha/beta fold hydrolase [Steroidobacteraceae bacterium]
MKKLSPRAVSLIASLLTLVGPAFADDAPPPALAKVGMVTRQFVDEQRKNWSGTAARPIRVAIWYPARDTARETETVGAPMFDGGTVAPDAPVSANAVTYPLILLSHGTGGSAIQLMWLGRYLAARGYVVAAINHHGNTGVEKYVAQGFVLFWERPRDVSVAIDRLLEDPLVGPRIDRKRIGAAGFSLGGYTVLALAGGEFSLERFNQFCASPSRDFTCGPQAEFPDARRQFDALKDSDPVVRASMARSHDAVQDPRIRAVFAIAPVLGGGFSKRGLKAVKIPVALVVGDGDRVAPPQTNAQFFADNIKGAHLTVLPGGVGHYTFLSDCTTEGRGGLPICRDAGGVNRAAIHIQVSQMAVEFFAAALKGDGPAT